MKMTPTAAASSEMSFGLVTRRREKRSNGLGHAISATHHLLDNRRVHRRITAVECRGNHPGYIAVGEPRQHYRGENSFPLILQNVHRYFLYLALLFLIVLAWDVWKALWFTNPATGRVEFGVGLGTLVLASNLTLLGSYTFSCHSLRHLTGGFLDQLSRRPFRMKAYSCVTCMNQKHMLWAWMSLFMVAFSDLYIRMCSMGIWSDWRLI